MGMSQKEESILTLFKELSDKEWEQTRNDERNELEKSKLAEKALFSLSGRSKLFNCI